MTYNGRSLDDLPLAAYRTGGTPEEPPGSEVAESAAVPDPGPFAPPAAPAPEPEAAEPAPKKSRRPRLGRLRRGKPKEAPDAEVAAAAVPAVAVAPSPPPFTSQPDLEQDPLTGVDGASTAVRVVPVGDPPSRASLLADQVTELARKNTRLLAGGAFLVVILVGVALLTGGSGAGPASGAVPSSDTAAGPAVTPVPPEASLTLTGASTDAFQFGSMTGTGGPASSTLSATWTDAARNTFSLNGPVDRGSRTTDEGLVLRWSVLIDGALVTFTSEGGECTVGMAIRGTTVSGTFACRKVTSDDGKYTVGASGSYRT